MVRAWWIVMLGCIAGVAGAGPAADWPQFRGPGRDGVARGSGVVQGWPAGGPRVVWRRPIGDGYSGVSVVGDRLYTMFAGEVDGKPVDIAGAFDARTGEPVWSTVLSDRFDTEFGNGPRTTPTVAGDLTYVMTARGDLAALATADGTVKWRVNLIEKFGGKQPTWGFASSALVDGDQLIVQAGAGPGKAYAALAGKTGEVLWNAGDAGSPYNSAVAASMLGHDGYLWLAGEALSFVGRDGKTLWTHAWPKGEAHASPIFVPPDLVFASGTEGVGAALFRVTASDDKLAVSQVWTTNLMRNHFSASVIHDGHVFGFDNTTLKCIALADGALKWRQRGLGKGSLILADGHLLVLSDAGELVMASATGVAYVEQGRAQILNGRSWTSPSLASGRLYLRNQTELVSLDLGGEGEKDATR